MTGPMIYGDQLAPRIADRRNALVWWHRSARRYGWRYLVRQAWLP